MIRRAFPKSKKLRMIIARNTNVRSNLLSLCEVTPISIESKITPDMEVKAPRKRNGIDRSDVDPRIVSG